MEPPSAAFLRDARANWGPPCLCRARRGTCPEARAVRAEPSHKFVAGQVRNDRLRLQENSNPVRGGATCPPPARMPPEPEPDLQIRRRHQGNCPDGPAITEYETKCGRITEHVDPLGRRTLGFVLGDQNLGGLANREAAESARPAEIERRQAKPAPVTWQSTSETRGSTNDEQARASPKAPEAPAASAG